MIQQGISIDHNYCNVLSIFKTSKYIFFFLISTKQHLFLINYSMRLLQNYSEPDNKSMCLKPTRWTTEEHNGL